MAVYVDKARNPYGRMIMCHMVADSICELLEMADTIGLARRHFQPVSHPHFDVSLAYKKKALTLGAVEVGRRELVTHMRQYRRYLSETPEEQQALREATARSDIGKTSSKLSI